MLIRISKEEIPLILVKSSLNIVRPPARSGQPIYHSLTLISLGVNSALIWLPWVFTLESQSRAAPLLCSTVGCSPT